MAKGAEVSSLDSYTQDVEKNLVTTVKNEESIFQKFLGTKTKRAVFCIVVGTIFAFLAVAAAATAAGLGPESVKSPGESVDPPVNGTGTPVVTTETPTEPPTINPEYPSRDSLCGYRPEVTMEPACANRPISFYENLNPNELPEYDSLDNKYVECVVVQTSTPCNNVPTFSNVTHLPDGIISAFAEQGRNSIVPIHYDAGFTECYKWLSASTIAETSVVGSNLLLRCSARRSDIEALPSDCACIPDNTINPSDVPPVATPPLPDDMFQSPSDSACGSRFHSGNDVCDRLTLYYFNSERASADFGTDEKAYESCVFLHNDAGCSRLPKFSNINNNSDRIYRFIDLLEDEASRDTQLPLCYHTGFLECLEADPVRDHLDGRISDEQFAKFQSECLIERAVAEATLSNCKCLPLAVGTITV